MYKLIRSAALQGVEEALAVHDDDVLQRLFNSKKVQRDIGQLTMFKVWHRLMPVDDLTDEQLDTLSIALGCDFDALHEEIDYSYLIDEYLETIENQNSRYLSKQWINKMSKLTDHIMHKDVQELTPEEVANLTSAMLVMATPASIRVAVNRVSVFCKWCIKNKKYPNAKNSFKGVELPALDGYVKQYVPKDEIDMLARLNAGGQLDDGDSAPVIFSLVWLGFENQEILDLRNDDVDFVNSTVKGVHMPPEIYQLFLRYSTFQADTLSDIAFGGWHLENLGYFVKRLVLKDDGQRCTLRYLQNAVARTELTIENVRLAGRLYRIFVNERATGECPEEMFKSVLHIETAKVFKDKKALYDTYKSVYWTQPD